MAGYVSIIRVIGFALVRIGASHDAAGEQPTDAHGNAAARRPLRLLHVFHAFGCGGSQTRLVRIANHFGPAIEHIIVAMNGDCASMNQFANAYAEAYPIGEIGGSAIRRFRQFDAVLARVRPDHLVTHNWGTIEWALPARRRSIHHIHIEDGFGPDEANGQKRRRVLARRLVLRRSDVVVPSCNLKRIAREDWKIPGARLHHIPNGIDCRRYSRTWRWSNEPVIGIVAGLRPEKNVERLLGAFALVNREIRGRLTIVGDGPERRKLEHRAQALGIADRVLFTGHVADPVPLYHSFNIFALTSDTEQMPYTVLEAMAAGLPIVSTDVGDVMLMISRENVPLMTGRSESAVADALLRVAKAPAFAEKVGDANARRARQDFDELAMFRAFAALYGLSLEQQTSAVGRL